MRREELRGGRGKSECPPAMVRGELVCSTKSGSRARFAVHYRGADGDGVSTSLEALARRPGVVLSRAQLLAAARDERVRSSSSRIVDTYVNRLRRKLEAIEPGFTGIETVVGAGYRWR